MSKKNDSEELLAECEDRFQRMVEDCVNFLEPCNTDCNMEWFVSRMVHHVNTQKPGAIRKLLGEILGI